MSTETMLVQAGLIAEPGMSATTDVEGSVRLDPNLTTEQKEALLGVYRSFAQRPSSPPPPGDKQVVARKRSARPRRAG